MPRRVVENNTNRTIVELRSGTPLGRFCTPGEPGHPAELQFVDVASSSEWDDRRIVPVVDAHLLGDWEGGVPGRVRAVRVPSVAALTEVGEHRPDFVVLDRPLVEALRREDDGRATLAAFVAYAEHLHIGLIADGVDDQGLLEELRELGVGFGAGAHIDRRVAPRRSVASAASPGERSAWLRGRLGAVETFEDAAQVVCEHVVDLGHLPSVYVERRGLMRCIAQRGYWQIMDGIPVDAGVLGRTFRLGRTQHVDARLDDDFIEAVPGLVAEITVPLRADGVVRSVFSVESTRSFTPPERLEIERVGGELERAMQRLGIAPQSSPIHRLSRAVDELADVADVDGVQHATTRLACDVAETSSAMLALDDAAGTLRPRSSIGPLATALGALNQRQLAELAADLGTISSCISGGDQDGRVRPALEALRRRGGNCIGVFPVRSRGQRAGLLVVADATPRELDHEAREALELLARAAGQALERVHLVAELRERAERDPLTMVGNRSSFSDTVAALDAAIPRSHDVAVLFADLDRFKTVNDRFGHLIGDRVLVDTAQALGDLLRPTDEVFRVGGDEFAAVLPGVDAAAAATLAERISAHAGRQLARFETSLSVGVAVIGPDERVEDALKRADRALYASKTRIA